MVFVNILLKLCPKLLITRGKAGVDYYEQGKKSQQFPSYKVKAKDTTGAGDCFLAACIAKLTQGTEITEAIDFATKAAAISVTKEGARSMPTKEEILSSDLEQN